MKLVIAATGASGSIYLQRLLEQIDTAAHENSSRPERSRQTGRETGTRRFQNSKVSRAIRRKRPQCSVRQRLGAI